MESHLFGVGAFASVIAGLAVLRMMKKQCGQKGTCSETCSADNQADVFASIKDLNLPVIDISKFFNKNTDPEGFRAECAKLASAIHEYGCAAVRDPRFREEENTTFLNMMESYFEMSDGKRDARPDIGYQVGVTPENVEVARDYSEIMVKLKGENAPVSPIKTSADHKWRFFWRMNPAPKSSRFYTKEDDRFNNVVPPEFPNWATVMNAWGNRMMDAQYVIAEMLALGLNLPQDAFLNLIKQGPHLLAPTGSDLRKYGKRGDILAGFHSDLNYLTIHGKSRYPGLFVWTRDGTKVAVKIPDGCLLIQAGKQLEYLTGGYVLAGYHEVVVTDATLAAIERKKAKGESMWRVSSTCFAHIEYDQLLQVFPNFKTAETEAKYPPIYAGDFVLRELEAINLGSKK